MPFSDPIIGGGGDLIRTAIRSPGYVPGSAGWSINRDGTAEFADAVLRGQLRIGDQGDGVLQPGGVRVLPPADVPQEIKDVYSPFGVEIAAAVIYRAAGFWYWWDAVCIHPTDAAQHFVASGVHSPDGNVYELGRRKYEAGTGAVSTIESPARQDVTGTIAVKSGGKLTLESAGSASLNGLPLVAGQSGTATIAITAATFNTANVTFPTAFPTSPKVFVTIVGGSGALIRATVFVTSVGTNGCTIRLDLNASATVTATVHWLAVL